MKEYVKLEEGEFEYIKVTFGNAPLLILRGSKGYLACSYIDLDTANIVKDAVARVKGVKNISDMLNATIIGVSDKAYELGVREGMKGKDALLYFV